MTVHTMKRAWAAALLTICAVGFAGREAGAQRLESRFSVGDHFPDLPFPALADGKPTRLSDFRGRKVMLHVFASW